MSGSEGRDAACENLRWACALLDGLVDGGVRQLILSPGSRSTPLVIAAQQRTALSITAILDERSAAFFTLGMARASERPVALLCTSGSAPAHWLPAVIEAHASAVPLVLLTADRPPSLRPWGANQTIDQTRLFGRFVLEFHDPGTPRDDPDALKAVSALGRRAAAVSQGRRSGPVHLNLSFPEPLVPDPDCEPGCSPPSDMPAARNVHSVTDWAPLEVPASAVRGRGILVCGPGTYPGGLRESLWSCAARLALPVLADPLSGLRFGPAGGGLVTRYDSLLRNPGAAAALRPDWVLRVGAAPVSKTLNEWLRGVPSVLLDPGGQWRDPTHDARIQVETDPAAFLGWLAASGIAEPKPDWLALWESAERRIDALVDDYLRQAPWCEPHLIRMLLDLLPEGSALFSANSLPVRQLDTWSGRRSRPLRVFGNRGVSGIDGCASTVAGLNAAGMPTLALLGDLALFHDLSGLLLADRLRLPLVVINNGGGRIFDYLPQHRLAGIQTLWRTPVALNMNRLADLFAIPYRQAETAEGLLDVLKKAIETSIAGLIEIRIDADVSRGLHQDFWRVVGRESIIPVLGGS